MCRHLSSILVGEEGLEPSSLSAYAPEAYVFANFTTRPFCFVYLEYDFLSKRQDLQLIFYRSNVFEESERDYI